MSAKKTVIKMPEAEGLQEPKVLVPTKGKAAHIDLYLKAKGIPLWNRGGMRAFAIKKGKEYASDQEFEELFKKY